MTRGGNNKHTMLGRLIFGEKRKQHASPSRHRSATRTGRNATERPSSGGDSSQRNPINVHDWAAWRTQLNEQMSNGCADRADVKQMREFLHGNSFYQQHSRDPSNGRYNGVQLLFSIPHAKVKTDVLENPQRIGDKNMPCEDNAFDQTHAPSYTEDHIPTSFKSVSPSSPLIRDKTINQLFPKSLLGNTGGFLRVNEQMIANDGATLHRSMRTPFSTSDRVHSTLQKAVKDGNVLEKIKAFEMQAAAAAQAESATKINATNGIHHRLQPIAPSFPTSPQRTLSPSTRSPLQQSVSPIRMPHEMQQQYNRAHRSRNIHPAQQRRDGNFGPLTTRESRKGAHVLEPAHGDIILKRRTPSQKTANDDDYTITAMSSLAHTISQGQHAHHRQQHHHHRTGTSRSRHRQEVVHDKRASSQNRKKHQSKTKESSLSATTKTNGRHRWLKGLKDSAIEGGKSEKVKQDAAVNKSKKPSKTKKKADEKEKTQSTKKVTSPLTKGKSSSTALDNNRVYGVPSSIVIEQTKSESTTPQLPDRIDEENESDREEKHIDIKNSQKTSKGPEKDLNSPGDISVVSPATEARPTKPKILKKLSSATDGEIGSKVDDETRFSRPTDDHAHHSELNDEDEELKSEGDVFIEESSTTHMNSPNRQTSPSIDESAPERRWQWSKETGGLIDKGAQRKKKSLIALPITLITRKTKANQDEEQTAYEAPQSEQLPPPVKNIYPIKKTQSSHPLTTTDTNDHQPDTSKQVSKQILHAIMNSMNNKSTVNADEFFENGPHTNPEETHVNPTD
ncbi:unnamed protein product [Adineta ricciae]|uniref:Uncharacterized protein n=1 Tax=Adineta ricciae TaxID=249248 RepID=A0A814SHK1_ADIRI|nr:unnamed protein product [Adineta ricciae]CAF1146552.1 unnamed protein product [Adineta ricciae]